MRLHVTVNGDPSAVDGVDPEERLLAVLRDRLGHVEVKDGCGPQGQCGSCTEWLDGKPRAACVIRARQADGRSVTTPTGLPQMVGCALAGAFATCGAVQCGFCVLAAAIAQARRQARLPMQ